jgi:hypothetical protein
MEDEQVKIDLSARRPIIDWEKRKIDDVLKDLERELSAAGIRETIGEIPRFYRNTYFDRTGKHPTKDDLWPSWETLKRTGRCWPACYPVQGGNEGYYCHIDVMHQHDKGMDVYPITFIKVWSWKDAYEIAVLSARLLDAVI